MIGKNDRIRLEILDHDSVAHFGAGADLYGAEDLDWLDILEGSDTSLEGSFDPSGQVDAFSAEEDFSGSLDTLLSLDEPEDQGFSHTFESVEQGKKGVVPREILEFDDHSLQWSALAIYEAIQVLYRTISDPAESSEVYQWLFGELLEEGENEVTFEQCCYAHNARPEVIRLRIMFELWRFNKYATKPFELERFDLPESLLNTIFIEHGLLAQRMANALWLFPGATIEDLKEVTSERELRTLPGLAERYFASPTFGERDPSLQRWYLTGINPIRQSDDIVRPTLNRQKRIELAWSRHFPE